MARIALVGCGKHMRSTLVPYLAQLGGIEVEVCVDRDEVAAQMMQLTTHARCWETEIEHIDTSNIDAALVALPAEANCAASSYLINQGVACFVEKPPASTSADITTLLQLANALEVYVQVGFNFRFSEAMVAFQSNVSTHGVSPYTATFEFRSKHPSGPEWGREDPVAAWLYHNGVHALDLLLWIVGDAHRAHASLIRTQDGKFTIVAMVEHMNSSISILELGTLTEKFVLRADLYTADAHRFCLPHLGEVVMPIRSGQVAGEVIYRPGNLDSGWGRAGYGPELKYFFDNYGKYKKASPSLLDALKASLLCDAIMFSLESGTTFILNDESSSTEK